MRLARTILAVAISAALAWLPLGASAAGVAMVHAAGNMSVHAHMIAPADLSSAGLSSADRTADAAMDCCPDDVKPAPAHHDGGKCPMGACCVAASLAALAGADGARIDLLSGRAQRVALPTDQVLSRVGSSPPFRPPRV